MEHRHSNFFSKIFWVFCLCVRPFIAYDRFLCASVMWSIVRTHIRCSLSSGQSSFLRLFHLGVRTKFKFHRIGHLFHHYENELPEHFSVRKCNAQLPLLCVFDGFRFGENWKELLLKANGRRRNTFVELICFSRPLILWLLLQMSLCVRSLLTCRQMVCSAGVEPTHRGSCCGYIIIFVFTSCRYSCFYSSAVFSFSFDAVSPS